MYAVVARLWRPVAASAIVHLLFLAVYLSKFHGDASVLICAGSQRTGVPPYECVTRTIGPSGHDGQFYYSLARAPWRCHGLDIDVPAGRHLRIGYPALCWLLSAGEPHLLFYVMPAVNFTAIVVLSALGAFLALRCGQNPWWGFVLPLGANLGISLPGTFEAPKAPVYVDGKLSTTLRGDYIVAEFRQLLDDYVAQRYGATEPAVATVA